MSDNVTNNPHDKYFKEVFSKKQNTIDLLKGILPKEIFDNIDFHNFIFSNKSYVDEELKDIESDLVIKTKLGKEDCFCYVLFEHKSFEDRYAFFQLLKYMMKIWDAEKKDKKKHFTPIIPVLFNQSGHKWTHGNSFLMYFSNPDSLLKKYLPNFNYNIYDLDGLSDDEIKGNFWFVSSIMIMKYIRNLKPILEEIYNNILDNIDRFKDYPDELKTFAVYLVNASNKKDDEYVKKILKSNTEDLYMSIAKEFVEKGRREEKIKTAKKMLKKGLDIAFISEMTGLSVEEIKKLK